MSSQRFSQANLFNDQPFSGNAAGILLAVSAGFSWSARGGMIRLRLENDPTHLAGHPARPTRRELLR
jgi:hypothetical protein